MSLIKSSGLETRDGDEPRIRCRRDRALYLLSITLGKRVKSLHPSKCLQDLQNSSSPASPHLEENSRALVLTVRVRSPRGAQRSQRHPSPWSSGGPRPSPHPPLGRPLRLRSPPSGQRLLGTRRRCRGECLRPQTGDHGAPRRPVPAATPSLAGAPREAGARPQRPPPAGHVGQSFGLPRWPLGVPPPAGIPQRLCSSAPASSSRLSHSNRQRPASFGPANGDVGGGARRLEGGAK